MDEQFLLNQELKNSGDKYNKIYNSVVEMQSDMRQQSREVYFRISLMSGGIVSLSVTYIGYLASLPNFTVNYGELLFAGWIALGFSLIGGIYRNHFNLDMGHWQTMEVLNKARLENEKATLKLMKRNPEQFIDAATNTVGVEAKTLKDMEEGIKKIEEAIKSSVISNKRDEKLWLISQNAAHIGFISGIILIAIFASLNIPVPIHFPLINSIKW